MNAIVNDADGRNSWTDLKVEAKKKRLFYSKWSRRFV